MMPLHYRKNCCSDANTFGCSPAKPSSGCSSWDTWPEKLGWPFVNLWWGNQSVAPRLRALWEYTDGNAPVSLILLLSSCRCPTASRLNQISPSSHSFRLVGCGLSVLRLQHWLFLLHLFTPCLWISPCIPQQQMTYHSPLKLLSGS